MLREHFHIVAVALALTSHSLAQAPEAASSTTEASRPSAAGRIVRLFDFEERESNPNPVPRFWTRNQDQPDRPHPGFPRFNSIELDELEDEPLATRGCVRLSTRGGSTSLLLDGGVIPVFKEADYLVGARVRTDGLQHARAALAVRFLDEKLRPIPASELLSEPINSQGRWTKLAVPIRGEFPQAAFVQFELLLLQPDQLRARTSLSAKSSTEPGPKGSGAIDAPPALDNSIELRKQDLSGSAYFDDVSIVQLPRLELTTQVVTNIIAAPESPVIHLLVRDLTGEALAGKLIVLDSSGRTVDTRAISIGEGRSRTNWNPALPGYGWYRAVLDMSNSLARVGATYLDFAWLPPQPESTPGFAYSAAGSAPRFWLISREVPSSAYPTLAQTCKEIRSSGLSVPVWTPGLTDSLVPARSASLRPLVDSFRSERLDLAFSLPVVPEAATDPKAIVAVDPWTLLVSQPKLAHPLLDAFLDDYGQTVQRWQIGWFGSRNLPAPGAFRSGLASIESTLGKLVPGPIVVLPTSMEELTVAAAETDLEPAVFMPHDALPTSCALAIEGWRDAAPSSAQGIRRLFAALACSPEGQLDASDAAASLVKRAVRVWSAATRSRPDSQSRDFVSAALIDPWTLRGERTPQLMPRPELAAWRATIDRLSNRDFVCEFPLPAGGEAYLFGDRSGSASRRSGVLVLWNDAAPPEQVKLQNYLGPDPIEAVDVFGNHAPLTDPSRAPLAISSTPVFIEGVDAELLHFVASFSIDPPLLSMTSPETQHNIQITNTWPMPISGTLLLLEPGGLGSSARRDRTWRINPRTFSFALAPGEVTNLPMTVSFGTAEEVGTKPFVFNVELAAGHSYEPFRVTSRMELGLRDISFSVTATPRGDDVILEATISNQSRAPLTLVMTAFPPEMPRQLVDVGEVMPGNQVIHRFTLRKVYPSHKGQRVPVAISDPEAGIRINRSVLIP
ncbi:MAG: hypothetical protein KF691_14515 [Phycisphaeraceae bacterium]|nr:hypothetical protein [Phycisphaeraceae bacterium]